MRIKKIAVLTSGGDAPGMNSAIYGVYTACCEHNIPLIGFIGGYDGLIDNKFVEIDFSLLSGKINVGGSVLKSSRSPRFLKKNYFNKALQNLKSNKIDALIGLIKEDPYIFPPYFEPISGEDTYARRINIQHRLVYQVHEEEKTIEILSCWTHYHE